MTRHEKAALIFSVFVAGLCSIVYELLIATTAAYFLGDSITQFSLIIGSYMAAMGIGSYLSRLIPDQQLLERFVVAELVLAVLGGLSVPLIYVSFAYTDSVQLAAILLTLAIGALIGLEIPLLSRLLAEQESLKSTLANVLSLDYLGALIATLLFPFVFLPLLGVFKSALAFGLINLSIATVVLWVYRDHLGLSHNRSLRLYTGSAACLLVTTLLLSKTLLSSWNNSLYTDRIVYSKETPYQQLVLTRNKTDLRLFLNGNLQFSSHDEYRYHESLVHIPMHLTGPVADVLMLGGGDGLAVRELLKYPRLQSITLVDLDPAITQLGQQHPQLTELNQNSLNHHKVQIHNQDAMQFLSQTKQAYDLILIDLPDPSNTALARLYSREFYRLIQQKLRPGGLFATQATSPFYAQQAFWSIFDSIEAAGFDEVLPYHINVPSFGEWGFVIGSQQPLQPEQLRLQVPTRYLTDATLARVWLFEPDIAHPKNLLVNTMDAPVLLKAYLAGWKYWQ